MKIFEIKSINPILCDSPKKKTVKLNGKQVSIKFSQIFGRNVDVGESIIIGESIDPKISFQKWKIENFEMGKLLGRGKYSSVYLARFLLIFKFWLN